MRIYIAHCSAKKDNSLKDTGKKVTPDKLYTATPIQCFINKCKGKQVKWVIFSDLYGVWFPNVEHEWYEKNPDTVTKQEFESLLNDFDRKLQEYDKIWFYYNPGRFYPLYERLLQTKTTRSKGKVERVTHIREIV